MPSEAEAGAKKSRRSTKKGKKAGGRKGGAPAPTKKPGPADNPDAERFVRDLLIRGEAARPTPEGDLPPGATHKIVEERDGELPVVERERFSIY
jgi:hypothetical protein